MKLPDNIVEIMAKEIIEGKHGTIRVYRRESLGLTKCQYDQVQRKVNELLERERKSPFNTNRLIREMLDEDNTVQIVSIEEEPFGTTYEVMVSRGGC